MNAPDNNDWENDPVWKLLDEVKTPEPGPFFVRNVMREVRLADRARAPWWQRLFAPKPLLAGALGACAALALFLSLHQDPATPPGVADTPPPTPEPAIVETSPLDELLEEEMLFAAAEDPAAFTDEALLELLE